MLNVAWHTYEPSFADSKVKSSAGGGAWMRRLFDAFALKNCQMVWLPNGQVPRGCEPFAGSYDAIDVAIFAWRWRMPNYPDRDKLYYDQMIHIEAFREKNIAVLVHDQDHKITDAERAMLLGNGVVIAEPSLLPRQGVRKLMFPNPYDLSSSFKVEEHRQPFLSYYKLVYIGNNYGRFEQTVNFLRPFSEENLTKVYGNWLEPNPERESAEVVRAHLPKVEFGVRISQQQVVETLAEGDTTIHLFKPSYGPCGFTTIRWAEAVAAQTPAFIPDEFLMPEEWTKAFAPMIVSDGHAMANAFRGLTEDTYLKVLRAQEQFVQMEMRVEPWIDIVKELA